LVTLQSLWVDSHRRQVKMAKTNVESAAIKAAQRFANSAVFQAESEIWDPHARISS